MREPNGVGVPGPGSRTPHPGKSPWTKTLYWRIALGLFAFVALMLAAEGALFLWISQRLAGAMPARSTRQLAALVSQDVAAALTRDPDLDLDTYLLNQYKEVAQTFFVVPGAEAVHDLLVSNPAAILQTHAPTVP